MCGSSRAADPLALHLPGSDAIERRRGPDQIWVGEADTTTWEQHRKAAISERQGNRNPFIDHPEWLPDAMAIPPR